MPLSAADMSLRADRVRARLGEAAHVSGRAPDAVTLVAVTKTHPVETVAAAIQAGLLDLGENRVQEMVEKAEALPGAQAGGAHRWHLIGSLQRNKARDAVAVADLVHGVDSARLAQALGRKATETGRTVPVLVQVNVSGEASKSGSEPDAAHDLMAAVAETDGLVLRGVMAIAAPADNAEALDRTVRPQLRLLRTLFDSYTGPGRVRLDTVSMGMSGDYAVAVEEGSTLVRVGSALFGSR